MEAISEALRTRLQVASLHGSPTHETFHWPSKAGTRVALFMAPARSVRQRVPGQYECRAVNSTDVGIDVPYTIGTQCPRQT